MCFPLANLSLKICCVDHRGCKPHRHPGDALDPQMLSCRTYQIRSILELQYLVPVYDCRISTAVIALHGGQRDTGFPFFCCFCFDFLGLNITTYSVQKIRFFFFFFSKPRKC